MNPETKVTIVSTSRNNTRAQVIIKAVDGNVSTKHLRKVGGAWKDLNGKVYTVS
jgi:hypothetical protein